MWLKILLKFWEFTDYIITSVADILEWLESSQSFPFWCHERSKDKLQGDLWNGYLNEYLTIT